MKKGFTLVELLTVVALLGIFALITIPAVANILDKQKERIQKQNVIAITDSLKTYNNEIEIDDGNTFSVSLAQLKLEGLLEYELKNPKTKKCYSNANVFTIKRVGESYKYTVGELQDGTDEDCEKPVRIFCEYDTGDNHEIGDIISYGDLDWYVPPLVTPSAPCLSPRTSTATREQQQAPPTICRTAGTSSTTAPFPPMLDILSFTQAVPIQNQV